MISREEIRQLAQIESPSGCAISFYFQPETPQNKSHRQEAIMVKDLVRECLKRAERNGNHVALREDLGKILQIAEGLHGNHSRGKVIFACREQEIWRELDVPPSPAVKIHHRLNARTAREVRDGSIAHGLVWDGDHMAFRVPNPGAAQAD